MIKKVEKDFDNVYGIEKVSDSFSFNRPCLLSIVPTNMNYKSINGYFSQLMFLMQIRSKNVDSNYTISNVPFDMLSAEFRENIEDRIIKSIPLGDVVKAKEFFHNINIFSYCAGNNKTTSMLNSIYNYLRQNNYNESEVSEILKEVFVLQIVDNNDKNDSIAPIPHSTTVVVQDIYDFENAMHVEDFNSDNPFISTMQINGTRYMFYNSFGEHSLYEEQREHIFKEDYVLAPVLNAVMSLYLIKAISLSCSDVSKKNISIYNELQHIIRLSQEYIKSINKTPETLTLDEKSELNKIILAEIKKVFLIDIPVNELKEDDKEYLLEKDRVIESLQTTNKNNIFDEFKECKMIIDEIIATYNNYSFGDIVGHKRLNSGESINITREDSIDSKYELLENRLDALSKFISNIKYPDSSSPKIKEEYISKIDSNFESINDTINSELFQTIMSEVVRKGIKSL